VKKRDFTAMVEDIRSVIGDYCFCRELGSEFVLSIVATGYGTMPRISAEIRLKEILGIVK